MNRRDIDSYFSSVKSDLESKLQRAEALLTSIELKLNEVESSRQQSTNVLASLNENYQSAINLINQTRTDLEQVSTLRTRAFDPDTGIETLLSKITTLSEQADKLASQISAHSQEAGQTIKTILETSKIATESLEEVKRSNESANKILKDLSKTYELAVNTGLAGSFDKRKKEIHDGFLNKWSSNFMRSLILLAVVAGVILFISSKNGFDLDELTIFRIALVSPLVFYVGYAATQYSKERRLLEKYAFKSAVAASLESYTSILSGNFKDPAHEKETVGFLVSAMRTIYADPEEDVRKRTFGLSLETSLAKFKSEVVEEVTDNIKKIIDTDGIEK